MVEPEHGNFILLVMHLLDRCLSLRYGCFHTLLSLGAAVGAVLPFYLDNFRIS
jgi:hypothetical protein